MVVVGWGSRSTGSLFLFRGTIGIEAGPVREVRGVEGLRLRAHYLINQRKAQSCPGPVDCGQLLSQRRGHGASQVSWGEDGATAAGALVASRRCILGQLGSTFIEAGPVEEIIADKAGRLPSGQGCVAQAAIGVVVAILEPLQIRLYDALGVIGYQAVLADVDPVLEAEQVGHLPLGALAKPHGRPPSPCY